MVGFGFLAYLILNSKSVRFRDSEELQRPIGIGAGEVVCRVHACWRQHVFSIFTPLRLSLSLSLSLFLSLSKSVTISGLPIQKINLFTKLTQLFVSWLNSQILNYFTWFYKLLQKLKKTDNLLAFYIKK